MPRPGVCLLAACTRDCTTECREAINRAWTSLRGELPPATVLASVESIPPSETEETRGGRRLTEPAQLRHTADSITNDALTALYDELAALKTIATGYCGHCGRGDCSPTADQWLTQQQRAKRAEATLDAVRKLADELTQRGNERTGNERVLGRRLLDLLDAHTTPTETT
ncbi:hypothetical protein ACWDXD_33405 [Streptomyces sp. NPDC003314]